MVSNNVPLLDTAEQRKRYVYDLMREAGAGKPTRWGPDNSCVHWIVSEITPTLAAKLLMLRHNQRSMKPAVVKKYVADLKALQWAVTGEGILFDKDWYLIEGQHRAEACVQAKKPITYIHVSMTTDPRANWSTGTGTKNSVADLVRKGIGKGVPPAVIAGIVMETLGFGRKPDTLSPPEESKMVMDYDLLADAITLHGLGKKKTRVTAGALAAALRAIRVDGVRAHQFFDKVFANNQEVDGKASKAARSLSNWLIAQFTKEASQNKGRQARHTTGFVREFEVAERCAREYLRWKAGDRRDGTPRAKGVMPDEFVPEVADRG